MTKILKSDERDEEWRAIGLAAPARRALVDAKLYKVSDLRKISLEDLTNLHGMGKSAIARLKVVMHGKKITFRNYGRRYYLDLSNHG
jgi:DNA repair protein RadC